MGMGGGGGGVKQLVGFSVFKNNKLTAVFHGQLVVERGKELM